MIYIIAYMILDPASFSYKMAQTYNLTLVYEFCCLWEQIQ